MIKRQPTLANSRTTHPPKSAILRCLTGSELTLKGYPAVALGLDREGLEVFRTKNAEDFCGNFVVDDGPIIFTDDIDTKFLSRG